MKPQVSVILPTRDRAHCLDRAVGSVIAQDFGNWELILVDDGSKDTTPILRRTYAETLGRRFVDIQTGGKGAAAARNAGIAAAKGEYIAFLDSDDVWLPEKLGVQLHAMERCEAAGLCFTDFTGFDDTGAFICPGNTISPEIDGNAYPALLSVEHNCVTTPSVMIRQRVLQRAGGFDESMRLCEDIDLWTRVARIAPVLPIRIPLVLVNVRPTEAFPYEASIKWRAELYSRAARRDPSLGWTTLVRFHRGLLHRYYQAATGRGDHHQKSVLNDTIRQIDSYVTMSPQELQALFVECAGRCGVASGATSSA